MTLSDSCELIRLQQQSLTSFHLLHHGLLVPWRVLFDMVEVLVVAVGSRLLPANLMEYLQL